MAKTNCTMFDSLMQALKQKKQVKMMHKEMEMTAGLELVAACAHEDLYYRSVAWLLMEDLVMAIAEQADSQGDLMNCRLKRIELKLSN